MATVWDTFSRIELIFRRLHGLLRLAKHLFVLNNLEWNHSLFIDGYSNFRKIIKLTNRIQIPRLRNLQWRNIKLIWILVDLWFLMLLSKSRYLLCRTFQLTLERTRFNVNLPSFLQRRNLWLMRVRASTNVVLMIGWTLAVPTH